MLDYFTSLLIATALVIAYLCVTVWLRHLARKIRQRRAETKEPPGTAFDTSVIAPQLERVRRDYLAAAHPRSSHAFYRTALVAAARRMVASLSYFHRDKAEHEIAKHDI